MTKADQSEAQASQEDSETEPFEFRDSGASDIGRIAFGDAGELSCDSRYCREKGSHGLRPPEVDDLCSYPNPTLQAWHQVSCFRKLSPYDS